MGPIVILQSEVMIGSRKWFLRLETSFANLSSIAILLGGLGSIAPSRRHDIARYGLKAVLAGTLSNLMSACIAGFFMTLGA